MNRIERWLAISSNIAVLIGIVFLALEISQNTDITRAELYQARTYDGVAAIYQVADSEYIAPLLAKFNSSKLSNIEDFALLNDVEKVRVIEMAQAEIRIMDNTLFQCELEFFDDNFCIRTKNTIHQSWVFWNAIVPGGVPLLYERLHQVNDQPFPTDSN